MRPDCTGSVARVVMAFGLVVSYEFDPRKTMQLIEETGYAKSSDGFYRDATGQRLTVEHRTPGGDDIRVKVQAAISDDWRRVGVDVEQVVIPPQQAQDRKYRVISVET